MSLEKKIMGTIAGMTLGDKLVEGFKPAIDSIKSLISSITADLNNARNNALSARTSYSNVVNDNSRTINNNTNHNYNLNVSNNSNSNNSIEREFRNMVFSIT